MKNNILKNLLIFIVIFATSCGIVLNVTHQNAFLNKDIHSINPLQNINLIIPTKNYYCLSNNNLSTIQNKKTDSNNNLSFFVAGILKEFQIYYFLLNENIFILKEQNKIYKISYINKPRAP